jgi:cytochrome bd-type quinol oxidase subunit 1
LALGITQEHRVALELMMGLFLILVLLNAWTTRVVFRDDLSSQTQRAAQIILVWLVPFLGALLTLHMKRREPE